MRDDLDIAAVCFVGGLCMLALAIVTGWFAP